MASRKPVSASFFPTNLVALVLGLIVLWQFDRSDPTALLRNSVIACLVVAAVIAAVDVFVFKVYRRPSTGLAWDRPAPANFQRIWVRLIGLAITLGVIACAYWLFPEYHGAFYTPFWTLLRAAAPWLLLITPFYFWYLDRVQQNPIDGYWEVGMLLTGRRPTSWAAIAQHFGGWTVKAFFVPLMVVFLAREIGSTHEALRRIGETQLGWYDFLYHVSFLVDLLFCVVGYCLTLRVMDSHIRSTEPTAGGWIVALLCYQPFYSIIDLQYLRYEDNYYWGAWLASNPAIQTMWAIAIVALLFIYALATVSFGLRFSNLTHRGIITSGPYRFSKHPAYLAKNASWWLISIPFISQQGPAVALRNCAALMMLNLIYFLRARTEERHLSRDPDYVAYAQWINQNGLLRGLGRLFPVLAYRGPVRK